MQQAAKTPTSPTPAAAQGPATNVVTTSQLMTPADVEALRQRKSELGDQIRTAQNRRGELRNQLRSATGVDKQGLEQQMTKLNDRIVNLEGDIAENGKLIASLDAIRAAGVHVPPPNLPRSPRDRAMENMIPMVIVFTLFVLCPIAISMSRYFWKASSRPATSADPEQARRLERMEHAIDSIAIEVERVSEGQRFVTRILAEGQQGAALGAGAQADRVQVQR